jgi:hypothetical protein
MRLQPSLAAARAARARGGARAHPRLPPLPSQARTGGKGTVRRKAAAVTKATAADDKRLGAVLKRLQCNVRALPLRRRRRGLQRLPRGAPCST